MQQWKYFEVRGDNGIRFETLFLKEAQAFVRAVFDQEGITLEITEVSRAKE
jgi:hypothetical protein